MKTIIVPLDFSNESLTGLNLALMLGKRTCANIKMVHVLGNKDDSNSELREKEYQLAKLKFEHILHSSNEKEKFSHGLTYAIEEGKIFEVITNLAENTEDALIVLSTHGNSGFEELFIGGNAYKITSHAKTPVVTIRGAREFNTIQNIVLPLDITFQTREKVPYTAELAKLFHSEIHLLSIQLSHLPSIESKLQQYVNQVASYLQGQGITYTVKHVQGDNLTDITLDYAHSINADLISIMTEQEKSVSNLLLGSYAHQMINKADIPILSFPNYQLRIITEDIWDLGAFNARN